MEIPKKTFKHINNLIICGVALAIPYIVSQWLQMTFFFLNIFGSH